MRRFLRAPTRSQKWMIFLMGVALGAILGWLGFEMVGVFSPEAEDTYSEWVFYLPIAAVLAIVGVQCLVGLAAIGSSWHFLEGWSRRRKIERARERPPV